MHILVSGAGVAGLSVGIGLAADGHHVTLVEKSTRLRGNGSPIDVRGEAVQVASKMGLLDRIRARRIDMTARVRFVDRDGTVVGDLPQSEIDDSDQDVEIPRQDLADILRDALPPSTTLHLGDAIDRLDDDGDGVRVLLQSGERGRYDLVVGADGLHSAVRRLAFGPEADFLHHLGYYTSLADLSDHPGVGEASAVYNYPGCMAGITRYRDKALAVFAFRSSWIDYDYHDLDAQRQILRDAFAGHDKWRIPELLDAARHDPAPYFDSISLIQMPTWSRGNVVLVGDSAHCASPLSGRGTSLALTGAWLLAEALREHPHDRTRALQRYEGTQRPHVTRAQATASAGGDLLVPATQDAIDARNRRLGATTS